MQLYPTLTLWTGWNRIFWGSRSALNKMYWSIKQLLFLWTGSGWNRDHRLFDGAGQRWRRCIGQWSSNQDWMTKDGLFCCLSITQCPKEYESLQISKIAYILQNRVMIKVNLGIGLIFTAFQWWLPLPLQKRRGSKFIVPILQRWRRQIPFQWRFLQPSLAKRKYKYSPVRYS